MSKQKKEPKVYTISETIHVCYQVVAMSEEEAREAYQNLDNEKWFELAGEAASNNYNDEEIVNEEDYDHESEAGDFPITEKAQKFINENLPEE
jgi:hypothetical protein